MVVQNAKREPVYFDLSERFRTPATGLSEVVYVSRRSPGFRDADLVNMIVDAGVRNYLAGVSGRLWYSASHFVQVIEGGQQALDATYARIARDPRHVGVTIVRRGRLAARRFDRPMHLFPADLDDAYRQFVESPGDAGFDAACVAVCAGAARGIN